MKNAKIDWLVEDGDSKSSISPLGINDFSDYQFVDYPLPEKLGKAWIETIRTKDKITLATATHHYIPQKQNPVIEFGAISENYEEISFYVRLSSRQLRLKNIHGEDCLAIVVYKQAVAQHLVQTGCSTLVSVKTDAFWENRPDGQLDGFCISLIDNVSEVV